MAKGSALVRLAAVLVLALAALLIPQTSSAEFCNTYWSVVYIDYFPDGDGIGYCDRGGDMYCEPLTCYGETSDHPVYYYGQCWTCYEEY